MSTPNNSRLSLFKRAIKSIEDWKQQWYEDQYVPTNKYIHDYLEAAPLTYVLTLRKQYSRLKSKYYNNSPLQIYVQVAIVNI
jgi:hypothetical protein